MSFQKITIDRVKNTPDLLEFLGYKYAYAVKSRKGGGVFVSSQGTAGYKCRSFGIVLPRGGMIIPNDSPTRIERIIKESQKYLKKKEEEKTENKKQKEIEEFLRIFSDKNDVSLLKEIFKKVDRPFCFFSESMSKKNLSDFAETLKRGQYKGTAYMPIYIQTKAWDSWDIQLFLEKKILPPAEILSSPIKWVLSLKDYNFYPIEVGQIEIMIANNKSADNVAKDMDRCSKEEIMKNNPRNKLIKGPYSKKNYLEMGGIKYPFSSQVVAEKTISSIRKKMLVFRHRAEVGIAKEITKGTPLVKKMSDESWTEGPKMRGENRYIGGKTREERTFLGSYKVDCRWDLDDAGFKDIYEDLLKLHKKGVDINPIE